MGLLSRKEKRDKKWCAANWGFCPEKKNEAKSGAPLIGAFVPKRKTRQKALLKSVFLKQSVQKFFKITRIA
ncbi:MAG: hypothetical protein E7387_05555 [Ruminococcaceae bacterium]|nr:hypothetical protein [Oscillospiraceae bacterium]